MVRNPQKSTAGWNFCCKWKDGFISWKKLSNLTELKPIQVVEYAVAQTINYYPAFTWLVSYVLKKGDRIISMKKWHSA